MTVSGFGRNIRTASAAVALLLAALEASAVTISWYEQRAPGHAAGEVRISDLGEGGFEFETPGRDLEVGIARHGDIAVVILDDRGRPAKPGTLLLVARQGERTVRATYPLAMPAQAKPTNPTVPEHAAANAGGGMSAASGPAPETEPAGRTIRLPETAANHVRPATASSAESVTGAARENGTVLAEASGTTVRPPASAILPAASNPSPDPAAVGADCRVLLLRPGSLRLNVQRLVRECGARMGRWNTSESAEFLVDWKVPADELLHRNNRNGLKGLLDLLEAHYRLAGVPDAARPGTIDFYRMRLVPYPPGRADADNPDSKTQ